MAGLDIGLMFSRLTENVQKRGEDLMAKMNELGKDGGNIDQTQMLKIQYEVNIYNALMEATSNTCKALVDETKQVAQRSS